MGLKVEDVAPAGARVWRDLRELAERGDAAGYEARCRELAERLRARGAAGRSPHETLRAALRLFERTGSAHALAGVDPARLSAPSRRFLWRRFRRYLRDDFAHRGGAERHLREALLAEPTRAAAGFRGLAPPAPDARLFGRLLGCAARVPLDAIVSYVRRVWHHRRLRPVALDHLRARAAGGDEAAGRALAALEGASPRPG
jgi:hypothetical protein